MKIEDERKIESDATPRPWRDDGYRVYGPNSDYSLFEYKHSEGTDRDGLLIVRMRNRYPDILDLIAACREYDKATHFEIVTGKVTFFPIKEILERIEKACH